MAAEVGYWVGLWARVREGCCLLVSTGPGCLSSDASFHLPAARRVVSPCRLLLTPISPSLSIDPRQRHLQRENGTSAA